MLPELHSVSAGLEYVGICLALILFMSFFVAAEYALVSVRKSRVDELVLQNKFGAETVRTLKSRIDKSIAGTQTGITALSMAIGFYSGKIAAAASWFPTLNIPYYGQVSPGIVVSGLVFLALLMIQVILGEQVPKQIALRVPDKTILLLSKPFWLFCLITAPIVWVMHFAAASIVWALRIGHITPEENHLVSPKQLGFLIDEAEEAGKIDPQSADLLQHVLELKALTAKDIMVPRPSMDGVPETTSLVDLLRFIDKTKHTKLPVWRGPDEVVGILHTRELFSLWRHNLEKNTNSKFNMNLYIRKPFFVEEDMPASDLLAEMRARRLQMAIIRDSEGAIAGLITLEDLNEQVVGEIWDEWDIPSVSIQASGEDTWHIQGELALFYFRKAFGVILPCKHGHTVAQAVFEALDREPEIGDTVTLRGFTFEVLDTHFHAITTLEVKRVGEEPATPSAA